MSLLTLADPDESMVRKYLNCGTMWGLFVGGEPVCEALVVPDAADACELKNLATREGDWGRGYARQLLEHVFIACSGKWKRIFVGTSDGGLELYPRFGFTLSHTVKNFFTDNYPEPIIDNGVRCVDMYYLVKDLEGPAA